MPLKEEPKAGFFGGMKKMLGLVVPTPGADGETPGEPEWEEFPWETYLIK